MITRFGTAPRRIGLPIDEFQAYWRGRHGEVAGGMPGIRRYWQNHAVLRDGEPILPWCGFDACSEFDFDNLAAMDRAFTSEQYFSAVVPDQEFLVDITKGGTVLTQRVLTEGAIDATGFRLVTFLRVAPQRSIAALGEALIAGPTASTAFGREIFLALDGSAAGQRIGIFDAVDVQWFAVAADAERYLTSAEARETRHRMADLVRGVERLIAEVRVII